MVAPTDGIVWDDEAPAQAAPVAAAPDDIQWDPPPPADFGNVTHGSNFAPMQQFSTWDRVRNAVSAVPEAVGAAFSGERYADTNTDPRRVVGVAEGAARTFGEDMASMGVQALEQVPGPLMAYSLYKRATGQETPADQYAGAVNQAIGVNDATMQFESPRAEMAARFLGHAAGAAVPLGPVGSAARVERTAALAGHLGPEVQGAAVADDILSAAKPRVRADETGQLREVSPEPIAAPTETPPALAGATPEQQATQVAADIGATPTASPERPTLYHASLAPDITEFRTGNEGSQSDPGVLGRGLYFDGDANRAGYYLGPKRKEGTLYGVDAGMENPAVFDSPQAAIEWQGGRGTDSPEAAEAIRQKYVDAGHDGVVIQGPNGDVLHAVSFAPERAKITERGPIGGAREPVAPRESPVPEQKQPIAEPTPPSSVAPEPPVTSTKNAVVNAERRARGLAELDFEGRRAFGEDMWAKARTKFDEDPTHAETLAREVAARPRPLSAEENASLILDRAHLNAERRDVTHEIEQAMERGDTKAEMAARTRQEAIDERLEISDRAARQGGGETALGLGSRRMMTREDYAPGEVLVRAKVAKRGPLTPEERGRLEGRTKRLEKLDKRVDESIRASQPRTSRAAQAEFDALAEQVRKIPKEKHMVCAS